MLEVRVLCTGESFLRMLKAPAPTEQVFETAYHIEPLKSIKSVSSGTVVTDESLLLIL